MHNINQDLLVSGDAIINKNLAVLDGINVQGEMVVDGKTTLTELVSDNITVNIKANVNDIHINGSLTTSDDSIIDFNKVNIKALFAVDGEIKNLKVTDKFEVKSFTVDGDITANTVNADKVDSDDIFAANAEIDSIASNALDTKILVANDLTAKEADIDYVTSTTIKNSESINTKIIDVDETINTKVANIQSAEVKSLHAITSSNDDLIATQGNVKTLTSTDITSDKVFGKEVNAVNANVTGQLKSPNAEITTVASEIINVDKVIKTPLIEATNGKFNDIKTKTITSEVLDVPDLTAKNATFENLKSSIANINTAEITKINSVKISAEEMHTTKFNASDAVVDVLTVNKGNFKELNVEKLSVELLNAKKAIIESLEAQTIKSNSIDTNTIDADNATIIKADVTELVAEDITATNISSLDISSTNIDSTNITADDLKADNSTFAKSAITTLTSTDATIVNGNITTLKSDKIESKELLSDKANIKNIYSDSLNVKVMATISNATIEKLNSTTATIAQANITNASVQIGNVDNLTAGNATIDKANITTAEIVNAKVNSLTTDDIKTDDIKADNITANKANIKDLESDKATIINGDVKILTSETSTISTANINAANIKTLTTDDIKTDNIKTDSITANKANIKDLESDKATIINGDVKSLTSETSTISTADINDANIKTLTTDDIKTDNIKADNITANKANIKDLESDKATIINGDVKSLTSDAATIAVANLNKAVVETGNVNILTTSSLKATDGEIITFISTNANINDAKCVQLSSDNATLTNTTIETLLSTKATISDLTATTLKSDNADIKNIITSKLTAENVISPNAEITTIKAKNVNTDVVNATDVKSTNVKATTIDADEINSKKGFIATLESNIAQISIINNNTSIVSDNIKAAKFESDNITGLYAKLTKANIDELEVVNAKIEKLSINELTTTNLNATNINAKYITISDEAGILDVPTIKAKSLSANDGFIVSLSTDTISTDSFQTSSASIETLTGVEGSFILLNVEKENVETSNIEKAIINDLEAKTEKVITSNIQTANVGILNTDFANIKTTTIDDATVIKLVATTENVTTSNIKTANIESENVTTSIIDDATITNLKATIGNIKTVTSTDVNSTNGKIDTIKSTSINSDNITSTGIVSDDIHINKNAVIKELQSTSGKINTLEFTNGKGDILVLDTSIKTPLTTSDRIVTNVAEIINATVTTANIDTLVSKKSVIDVIEANSIDSKMYTGDTVNVKDGIFDSLQAKNWKFTDAKFGTGDFKTINIVKDIIEDGENKSVVVYTFDSENLRLPIIGDNYIGKNAQDGSIAYDERLKTIVIRVDDEWKEIEIDNSSELPKIVEFDDTKTIKLTANDAKIANLNVTNTLLIPDYNNVVNPIENAIAFDKENNIFKYYDANTKVWISINKYTLPNILTLEKLVVNKESEFVGDIKFSNRIISTGTNSDGKPKVSLDVNGLIVGKTNVSDSEIKIIDDNGFSSKLSASDIVYTENDVKSTIGIKGINITENDDYLNIQKDFIKGQNNNLLSELNFNTSTLSINNVNIGKHVKLSDDNIKWFNDNYQVILSQDGIMINYDENGDFESANVVSSNINNDVLAFNDKDKDSFYTNHNISFLNKDSVKLLEITPNNISFNTPDGISRLKLSSTGDIDANTLKSQTITIGNDEAGTKLYPSQIHVYNEQSGLSSFISEGQFTIRSSQTNTGISATSDGINVYNDFGKKEVTTSITSDGKIDTKHIISESITALNELSLPKLDETKETNNGLSLQDNKLYVFDSENKEWVKLSGMVSLTYKFKYDDFDISEKDDNVLCIEIPNDTGKDIASIEVFEFMRGAYKKVFVDVETFILKGRVLIVVPEVLNTFNGKVEIIFNENDEDTSLSDVLEPKYSPDAYRITVNPALLDNFTIPL